ncbi:UDP-glucose--sterol glucosyltransferase [Streptomyces cellostaticus]|uniref:UDP-glucose--sterol glucosyltransferase n=1 Tax=Streptomyces cellostaticus TaxID=67285 RepID=A0A101NG70_9ACTN|nr:glycosyltransferase [Streptomyces cellostaticus]KUM92565.1 UDP-glucose--sterol glucosyltransferase [Streptomyces cellostaticus]GHI10447.1 glycosyl transferase [Streptomyces cellostaticus]
MRITIATAGSRGDVAPYTGLGAALRHAGHEVAVATTGAYAPLVREAGLELRDLPAVPRADQGVTDRRELMRSAAAFITELGQGFTDAVGNDTDLLLLSATTAPFGWHLTEATGLPSLGVYLQPTTPTGAFPPPVTGTRSLSRPGNRLAGRLALRITDRLYAQAVVRLRERLGLPPLTASAMRRRQEEADWPILHGFSTALVPRPTDWRPGLQIAGTWWPHHTPTAQLPATLEDFLAAGPRPVLIGFGSMAAGDGERLSELAVRALRRAGLRGILQSGRAGLVADADCDDVLTIGDVPHALLFPRLAAVVHHAGAGTSAAALRAGVPAVTVPVTADQPFWAARLAALGAAPDPIPFRSLTAERLADALSRVVRQLSYARAAETAARHMATEDGVGRALERIQLL